MSKRSEDSDEAEGSRSRYDDALLSANWNPVIELLDASASGSARTRQRRRAVISDEDADAFLGRIYASGA